MRVLFGFLMLLCGAHALIEPSLGRAQIMLEEAMGASTEPSIDPGNAAELSVVTEEPASPDGAAISYNAQILDEILVQAAEATIREEKFAAAAGIMGGTILVGLGVWRLAESPEFNAYTRGLGVMFMTLGMADLTTGVFAATRVPHERRRLERWKKVRHDGINATELAHFEGELQASHEMRQGERRLVRWTGLTHAIAGVVVLAFTPIPDSSSRSERVSGYVIGGVFVATGMAAFATSFRGTPSEKAWAEYNRRKMPMPGHEFSWRLAPAVSRRTVGLSFGARF